LSKARLRAQSAVCISNLKMLGLAHQMYVDDNKGYALYQMNSVMGSYLKASSSRFNTGWFNSDPGLRKYWMCPVWMRYNTTPKTYPNINCTYTHNTQNWGNNSCDAPTAGECPWYVGDAPASVIVFFDGTINGPIGTSTAVYGWGFVNDANPVHVDGGNRTTASAPPSGGIMNAVFYDGHAAAVTFPEASDNSYWQWK